MHAIFNNMHLHINACIFNLNFRFAQNVAHVDVGNVQKCIDALYITFQIEFCAMPLYFTCSICVLL